MKKMTKYLFMLAFIGLAIVALNVTVHDASASTIIWKGTTSADAAVNTNWNPAQVPTTGDSPQFTSSFNNPCTWDLTASMLNVTINGYTSTITFSKDMTVTSGGFYQTSGTVTMGSQNLNISSNVIKTGGSLGVANIQFYGNGILNTPSLTPSLIHILPGATVTESCTITTAPSNAKIPFVIDAGGVLNIGSTYSCNIKMYGGNPPGEYITNNGIINGPGTLTYLGYSTGSAHVMPGTVNGPFAITQQNGGTGNVNATLDGAISGTSTMTISSSDPAKTMNMVAKSFSISATSITIGTRGKMAGNGTITISGTWDSSLGSWTSGTSTLYATSIGTTKLASGQSFWNVETQLTAVRTLTSNLWVRNHYGINGTLISTGYYVNISSNIAIPLDIHSGTFTAFYLNGTANTYQVNFRPPMSGYVYSKATVTYYSASGNVTIYSAGSNYIGCLVEHQTFPTHYEFYLKYATTTQTIDFQITNMKVLSTYQIAAASVNVLQLQTNYAGTGAFFLNGPWTSSPPVEITADLVVVPVVTGPDYTGMFMALFFLSLVTLFNVLGYFKGNLLLVQLIAITVMMPGIVWAIVNLPGYWYIPLLFTVVNLVMFVLGVINSRGGRR